LNTSQFENMCLNKVAAGNLHSFLVNSSGFLSGWGFNNAINLVEIPDIDLYDGSTYLDIAIGGGTNVPGGGFNVALRNDGTISAWGETSSRGLYISPPAETENYGFDKVGATLNTAIAKRNDNSLYLWGDINISAIIINNISSTFNSNVSNYYNKKIKDFSCGYSHILLQTTGKYLEGLSDFNGNFFGAATIPNDLGKVKLFAAGYGYSLVLKDNGIITGWGVNGLNDNLSAFPPSTTQQIITDFYGSGQLNIPYLVNQFGSGISGNILKLYGGNGYAAALITGIQSGNFISGVYTWGANPWYSGVPSFIYGAKDINIGRRSMLIINSGNNLIYYGFNSGWTV